MRSGAGIASVGAVAELPVLAVLMGGPSPEFDVSLDSASEVIRAVDRTRFRVRPFLITRSMEWIVPDRCVDAPDFHARSLLGLAPVARGAALDALAGARAAFIAMHGPGGEDGTVQGLLEFLDVPYTGALVGGSALARDKIHSKEIFAQHQVPMARSRVVREDELARGADALVANLVAELGPSLVVKIPTLGSSVGVFMVEGAEALAEALARAVAWDGRALVEEKLPGREVTCGVLGGAPGDPARAFPPILILPPEGRFFDYDAKYTAGVSQELCPAPLPEPILAMIQARALAVHHMLGLTGFSRTDMILGPDDVPRVLEVNTIPGLTRNSLFPKAGRAAGLGMTPLVNHLVDAAIAGRAERLRRREMFWRSR